MTAGPNDPQQLILEHQGLVRSLAFSIRRNLPSHVELDDLVAYGQVGLAEAAREFDPSRGIQFPTFAYYRVRGAIYDGLSQMAWFSRGAYHRIRYQRMAGEVLREESEAAQSSRRDDLEDDVRWFRDISRTLAVVYLAATADPEGSAGQQPLEDRAAREPPEVLIDREVNEKLLELIDALPPEAAALIRATYFEGLTLQEAGRRLGISKSWASRLHARTLQQLGRSLRLIGAAS